MSNYHRVYRSPESKHRLALTKMFKFKLEINKVSYSITLTSHWIQTKCNKLVRLFAKCEENIAIWCFVIFNTCNFATHTLTVEHAKFVYLKSSWIGGRRHFRYMEFSHFQNLHIQRIMPVFWLEEYLSGWVRSCDSWKHLYSFKTKTNQLITLRCAHQVW